jgi:hypothetical protein
MAILADILRWIANRMSASPLTLGITSDVGAVSNFLAECIKAGLDWSAVENSIQMIQGRANVAKETNADQNAKDADAALKTGDLTAVDKDLS